MARPIRWQWILFGACAALAGCASTGPIAYQGLSSSPQLQPNANGDRRVPLLYSAPGVTWSGYTRAIFDPVLIYQGADAQFGKASDADKQALATYMQQQFAAALNKRYGTASMAASDTLRIDVTLTGIQTNVPVASTVLKLAPAAMILNGVKSIRGKQAAFSGSVSFAVEVRDSVSGRLLRAYVSKQYPVASSLVASVGSLEAAKVGARKGANDLVQQLQ